MCVCVCIYIREIFFRFTALKNIKFITHICYHIQYKLLF